MVVKPVDALTPADRVLVKMYAWFTVRGTSAIEVDGRIRHLSAKGIKEAQRLVASNEEAAELFKQTKAKVVS